MQRQRVLLVENQAAQSKILQQMFKTLQQKASIIVAVFHILFLSQIVASVCCYQALSHNHCCK
jgi:hypothetical protein